MFTGESHIISCLINRYNYKVFFRRKHGIFNFMFTENWFFWSTCYFIFKDANFFIYWSYNMTLPFWKMVLVDAFLIWYSPNEWSIPVCISSQSSSKQICFSSPYFGPFDMSWGSLSLLTIFRFPVTIWP